MRLGGRAGLTTIVAVIVTACGSAGEEADVAADTLAQLDAAETLRRARADSVAMAEELYDPAVFDSIAWRDQHERLRRGEDVWEFSCGDCHGWEGRGDGPVATRHRYEVPDFTAVEWEPAGLDSLRHRVFVGHESEMPSWGLYGLTYRDVDAVAYYVEQTFGEVSR